MFVPAPTTDHHLGAKDQMLHPLVVLKVHRSGPHFDEFAQPNLADCAKM